MDAASKKLYSHKIKTAEQLSEAIGQRPRKQKVIMCHGTFDVVHPGHVRHLLYAKTKADILVASLTADEHIKKGNMRPYVPQDLRAINLAAMEMVDYVVIDSDQKMRLDYIIELEDWYQDSRACYRPVALQTIEQSDYHWFATYYKNAAKFWEIELDKYANILLSETPPIMMHTESVVNMLLHCDKSLIFKNLVHEFGLYWTYLIKENLVEKLYTPILNISKRHQLIHERV